MIQKRVAALLVFLGASLVLLTGCSCAGGAGVNRTDIEWPQDMIQQNPLKPQEGGKAGALQMLLPPEGAKALNRAYYPYAGDPVKAGEELENPLPLTPDILKDGRDHYRRFCIYCHGAEGDSGAGASVAPKMLVKPASLLTDKAKGYSDGRLYHIIQEGQGLMGGYRIQLGAREQVLERYFAEDGSYLGSERIWAVVHYVRALQNSASRNESPAPPPAAEFSESEVEE